MFPICRRQICMMGKYHNVLYIGLKVAWDWAVKDSSTICQLLGKDKQRSREELNTSCISLCSTHKQLTSCLLLCLSDLQGRFSSAKERSSVSS